MICSYSNHFNQINIYFESLNLTWT